MIRPLRNLRHLFQRPAGERVDAELAFHVEMRTRELVGEGVAPDEAARLARAAFANRAAIAAECVAIAEATDRRTLRREYFGAWRDDVRFAARQLRRAPAFTLGVVATLALGIGVSTTVFSLLDTIFWRWPAGVSAPGEIRRAWIVDRRGRGGAELASPDLEYPRYRAIAAAAGPAATALYSVTPDAAMRIGSANIPVRFGYATAGLFPLLGARPLLGRFYDADEDRMGAAAPVVVISERLWRITLAADPRVVGSQLEIARVQFTVIGIAAAPFAGADLEPVDAWVPFGAFPGASGGNESWWESRNYSGFQMLIRPVGPDPGFPARATIAVRNADSRLAPADSTVRVTTGSVILARGPGASAPELAIAVRLGGVAVILLLIVMANVVGLMLARAVRRRHEIAMRLALGVSRPRLARLLISESALLAALAAVAATAAAIWGGALLRTLLFPDVHWSVAPMHWHVAAFAAAASAAMALLAGLVPLGYLLRSGTSIAVKGNLRSGGGTSRVRALAVLAQVALSTVLLVGAALFVQSLRNVQRLEIGYDVDRLIYVTVRVNGPSKSDDVNRRVDAIVAALAPSAGIDGVSRSSRMPMQIGGIGIPWYADGDSAGARPSFRPTVTTVAPGYFATVGLQVVAGEPLHAGERAVVVNQVMASTIWPGRSPLGQCMRLGKPDAPCHTVTGVVRDAKRSTLTEPALPQYFVASDDPETGGAFTADVVVLRVRPERADQVESMLQQRLGVAFPDARIRIERLGRTVAAQFRPWRLGALLFSAFGILALIVASIGIYSTVSYEVAQRMRDFGIRAALGATLGHIVAAVLRAGLAPVAAGVAVGVGVAAMARHVVAALLYGVEPGNPAALVVAALTLLLMGLVSALIPARRAAKADPLVALRQD